MSDIPQITVSGEELHAVAARRAAEAHARGQRRDTRMVGFAARNAAGQSVSLTLFIADLVTYIFVSKRRGGREARINIKRGDSGELPVWVWEAVQNGPFLAPLQRPFAYTNPAGKKTHIVGAVRSSFRLRALPLPGYQAPEPGHPLYNLGHQRFAQMVDSGALAFTTEDLPAAGWIWHMRGLHKLALLPNPSRTFRGPGVRPPLDLSQSYDKDCFPAVVANILWMFGKSDATGLEALKAADRVCRRRPGQGSGAIDQQLAQARMLQMGLELVSHSGLDEVLYFKDPVAAIRAWYGRWWNPSREAVYDTVNWARSDRINELLANRWQRMLFGCGERYRSIKASRPGIDDIQRYITGGYVVYATTVTQRRDGLTHAVLVFDHDEHGFAVYYPDSDGATIRYLTHDYFYKIWRDTNILAVRLP